MFQTTGSGTGTPTGESFSLGGSGKDFKIDFIESQKALSEYSNRILEAFTQTRERVYEIQTAIADATPGVRRLGGDIKDVSEIISQVALASRRNVISTAEEVEKLYTIQKVLGLGAETLSNSFLDVGLSIERIPETLEKSMNYVQSIGGNAKTVIGDVQKNMEQMNRYQFEGGVQGLTKMAARASMLRFEMKETFALAEKVLDPEGAIEVAGAFQRLGVAAGNLVDPFQLMNMSINDPSGLQDSLADIAKQFTEFDADTKTFKINPQGVLTLREMEKAAGLSAGSLSKMGLAASELDQRLSAIDAAGLTIASEEDKQYLANIAKMDSVSKTYKVTLEDGTKKELKELTQPEFDRLIDFQKNQPATLEETAKASLRLDEILNNNVAAIKAAVVGGVLTAPTMQNLNESIRTLSQKYVDRVSRDEKFSTDSIRKKAEKIFEDIEGDITNIISKGTFSPDEILTELMAGSGLKLGDLGPELLKEVEGMSAEISTDLLAEYNKFKNRGTTATGGSPRTASIGIPAPTETTSYGNISVLGQTGVNPNFSQGSAPAAPQKPVEVDGDIKVDVKFQNLPTSLTPEQIAEVIKTFNMAVNEQAFKNYIININRQETSYGSNALPVY
jgi:hypothetical protein